MRYSTRRDAIDRHIRPALEPDGTYDLDAICEEAFAYRIDTNGAGQELLNTGGFEMVVSDDDFWMIVARHEIHQPVVLETDARYLTADGEPIQEGVKLFSYYNMRGPITVHTTGTPADPANEDHSRWDGWFETSDGPLDGERLCSLEHARTMGWLRD